MQVTPLVMHLRANCPSFTNGVSGGIDWESIERSSNLKGLAAYLVLTDEHADPSEAQNKVVQDVSEEFDVCVVFPQRSGDERGLAVGDLVDAVRKELCRALVGYSPDPDYDPIEYTGREMLLNSRDKAVYRFSFVTAFQLGRNRATDPAETWQEREADGLPPLEGLNIDYDFIDPLNDKNLSNSGRPDGRVEFQTREDLPQ